MLYIALFPLLLQIQAGSSSMLRIGPVTAKDVVSFRLGTMSLELAEILPIRLRVDNPSMNQPYATLLPPRKCNRQGQGWECEAYIPPDAVTMINVPGRHEVYAFTFDGNCCESAASSPWTITTPRPPVLLRIQ